MIKRVNSTGRRRIARSHVLIEVFDGAPRSFDAHIDLSDFEAPVDAAVVLEATCAGSNTISRFEWGTVGNLAPPARRELRDLPGQNVFFSLKVIDRTERFGRILGLADNIRPIKGGAKTAVGRRGILPTEQADLGEELWQLEFRSEDVFLLVNQGIPGLAERMRFDPAVYSLVYPAIIREILTRAMDEEADEDDDTERWPQLWLQFAKRLHPNKAACPPADSEEEREDWIADVVEVFCREHGLKDAFLRTPAGATWGDSA